MLTVRVTVPTPDSQAPPGKVVHSVIVFYVNFSLGVGQAELLAHHQGSIHHLGSFAVGFVESSEPVPEGLEGAGAETESQSGSVDVTPADMVTPSTPSIRSSISQNTMAVSDNMSAITNYQGTDEDEAASYREVYRW